MMTYFEWLNSDGVDAQVLPPLARERGYCAYVIRAAADLEAEKKAADETLGQVRRLLLDAAQTAGIEVQPPATTLDAARAVSFTMARLAGRQGHAQG